MFERFLLYKFVSYILINRKIEHVIYNCVYAKKAADGILQPF